MWIRNSLFALFLTLNVAYAGTITPQIGGGFQFDGGISSSAPVWVKTGATIDIDFANNRAFGCATLTSCITVTRASQKTNLLPSSTSGFAYTTFGNNIAAITSTLGILIEESRTNQLLNSAVPATQTTGTLANGTYTLWVNGSGSATMSAGTATGCGTGVATQGTPVNFTTSGTVGTCTVTVTGSLNFFQLEAGAFGTSGIITTGAAGTRNADVIATAGLLNNVLQSAQGSGLVKVSAEPVGGPNNVTYLRSPSWNMGMNSNQSIAVVGNNGSNNLTANLGSGTIYSGTVFGFTTWGPTRALVFNNGTVSTSAVASSISAGTCNVFNNSVSGQIDTYAQRLTLWSSPISNAAGQSFTTGP